MSREDAYFAAMSARDPRFDGKFYVGVKTTGIYCRPICPAKPKRENVEFFRSPLDAERAGYRPCMRCRPECAPSAAIWVGKSAVVQRALRAIYSSHSSSFPGEGAELDEEGFAARFGVSARHLRRLFREEIGKTPKQIATENRLNLARKLIIESAIPIADVAFAAGFKSVRRFNDAFKDRFKKSPSELRRSPIRGDRGFTISLSYRPPFDFEGLLNHYRAHRVGDLEKVEGGTYRRVIGVNWGIPGRGRQVCTVVVSDDSANSRILVEIDFPITEPRSSGVSGMSIIHSVISRVRSFFDLDSDPVLVANALEHHAPTARLLRSYPGIRLPSGWDPFETAISTILGQLVSVERGRALVADLVELLGEDSGLRDEGRPIKLFPSPERIASADLAQLKTTAARKRTLAEFSRAIAEGKLTLEPTQDVESFMIRARKVPGIGPWTASYMALKCLRHTDAFPATDLVLAEVIKGLPQGALDRMRPWRGYAAALYWRDWRAKSDRKRNQKGE